MNIASMPAKFNLGVSPIWVIVRIENKIENNMAVDLHVKVLQNFQSIVPHSSEIDKWRKDPHTSSIQRKSKI